MSDIYEVSDTEQIASATTETVLQLCVPSTTRPSLIEFGVSFVNPSSIDGPALIQLLLQTTAGTSSDGPAPAKMDQAAPTSLVTTLINFTAEPSASTVLYSTWMPVQAVLEKVAGVDEIRIPASGRLGLRINSTSAQTVHYRIKYRD